MQAESFDQFARDLGYNYGWPLVIVAALVLLAYLWYARRRHR